MVLTDYYIAKDGDNVDLPSADEMIIGLKSLLVDTGLQKRMVYVPKTQETDPIDLVDNFVLGISETERAFAKLREDVRSNRISFCLG